MRLSPFLHALFVLALLPQAASAQMPAAAPKPGDADKPRAAPKPGDVNQQALYDRVRAAYYHPGKLTLTCDGSMDFSSIIKVMGGPTDTDGAKALTDLRLHLTTTEGGPVSVSFTWQPTKIPNDVKKQLEAGARQLLDAFFQLYWPVSNASVLPTAANEPVFTPGSDGSMTISSHQGADTSMITIGSDALIHRMVMHTVLQAQDTTVTLHYKAPANPQPGDLMRLASIESEQVAGNGMRVHPTVTWDEQDVNGAHLPRRIRLALESLFEVPTTLSACSATPAK